MQLEIDNNKLNTTNINDNKSDTNNEYTRTQYWNESANNDSDIKEERGKEEDILMWLNQI